MEKISQIIEQMTLEEKISLLTGKNMWETASVERLGIRSVVLSDGPHGVRKETAAGVTEAICFPTSSAMAATWNEELICAVGEALGEECRVFGVDVLLGPGVNIKRVPVCGRNFEFFTEDPYLSGKLGSAYIKGVQSMGVGACLKHFAANNQETDRFTVSAEMDERTLREIYLRPFEIAVKEAKPWMVMCAYNRLNGIYCSENNFLLQEILREEWGFDGVVVSDWNAVRSRSKALQASLELEMPHKGDILGRIDKGLEQGIITGEHIDRAVEALLMLVGKAGSTSVKQEGWDRGKHHALAKNIAREAITLLKNEEDILPIDAARVKKIAVLGDFAEDPVIQGLGSASVHYTEREVPLDFIRRAAGDAIEVAYAPVYNVNRKIKQKPLAGSEHPLNLAKEADLVIAFVGLPPEYESEGFDRGGLELPQEQQWVLNLLFGVNKNIVLILQSGSPVNLKPWSDRAKAVLYMGYAGQAGGSALADILFGKVNPSGKLAETFPVRLTDTPVYGNYPGDGKKVHYGEGLMVGYRYYDTCKKPVLYPFGHGLSYTGFDYSDIEITSTNSKDGIKVTVSLKLKNSGQRAGKETVQIYIGKAETYVTKPEKELKAFKKVHLEPGEEKDLVFKLDLNAFAYYNLCLKDWCVENGEYTIFAGTSSADIRLRGFVTINDAKAYTTDWE